MVFKRNVVEERLAFLKETLEDLRKLKKVSQERFLTDKTHRWATEHGLHLAAEAIFDIGNHILVGHFGARAVHYDKVLATLHERGVVSKKLVDSFERLGGFRNILVHEYLDIDPKKVFERLQNGLGDFEVFLKEIVSWVKEFHE